jgi:hypothetical protein
MYDASLENDATTKLFELNIVKFIPEASPFEVSIMLLLISYI